MRVILDTSTILSFLLSRAKNNTREIIKLAKQEKIQLLTCKESFTELQRTIASDHVKKTKNYDPRFIGSFIAWYKYHTTSISLTEIKISTRLRDLKDNMYIQLAYKTHADYLISGDKDLLVLKNVDKTKITTPNQFIKNIESNKKN